jgi:DNA-binding transcriptional ArsR family regulator
MPTAQSKKSIEKIAKYADMFSAMGTEPRLRIMQLLLSAHPDGLVVGEIQEELDIPNSTLSHHLDKLKAEDLVHVERESTFLHYTANTEALQELLQFLYAECCTRNKAAVRTNRSPDLRGSHEQHGHQRSGQGEVRTSSIASDERWSLLLWSDSIQRAGLRSDYNEPL